MKAPAARLLLLPVFYKLYNVFAFNKILLVLKRNTFSYLFQKTKILRVFGKLVQGIDYLEKCFFKGWSIASLHNTMQNVKLFPLSLTSLCDY